ncbi:MAG: protein-glutamate O-methyltransferase CheR [Desulfobacter sp.]|nr:protein-glutamate O-methyltransferase CheR [Desulfobacter sp.]
MNSIVLSKKQFNELKDMVYALSGIYLHEGKLELLKSKLAKRMRMTKKNFKDYLHYLKTNENEVIEFIDTMTTNHSFFFRENKSIAHIVNQLNTWPAAGKRPFKIWCAACSTGDEPYTIAIQLAAIGRPFSILATDISHSVLATATRGIYRTDKLKNVPTSVIRRYFQQGSGKFKGFVRIKKEIAAHIRFERFNLVTDSPPPDKFDAVSCRNVMIYFDMSTSEKVVNKLYHSIRGRSKFCVS